MSTFVNSLKRLYKAGKRSLEDIQKLLDDGRITEEEFAYITEE